VRQGQCIVVLTPSGEDRRSEIPVPAGKHLSKKFLERLPIINLPTPRKVLRPTLGKPGMVKDNLGYRALLQEIKLRNRIDPRIQPPARQA